MICSEFDSDLTDEAWVLVKAFIPPPLYGGRPRKTALRGVVNGILYILKTGAQWRQLPKHNFPPWQTVYGYFRLWKEQGVWERIHIGLHGIVRSMAGHSPIPSAIVIDSQSVKTGKMASIESRGFDGGKRIKGRKRHIVVDTLGLLVDVSVTPANVHDTKGAQDVLSKIAAYKKTAKKIQTIFADVGYGGANFAGWVKGKLKAVVEIGKNLTTKFTGFIPAKKRWVVERGFAWIGDYRRLSVDHERLCEVSSEFIKIAFINLMLRRLWPPKRRGWV